MAYYTGSAADMNALLAALVAACADNGWSWSLSSNVLSKGALHLLLTNDALNMSLTGRTSAGAGDMPNVVQMGRLFIKPGLPTLDITYPAQYEIFVFTDPVDEVWLVVRYDVDRYQWCAFGGSAIAVPGTGMWVAAIRGSLPLNHDVTAVVGPFFISPTAGGMYRSTIYAVTSGAWGWNTDLRNFAGMRDIYMHSNLDAHGWNLNLNDPAARMAGVSTHTQLIAAQPSAWNSEAALIPMRLYKIRPSNKLSLVVDAVNARHLRIDNYEPGQIIEIGAEKWKVFPWHRKSLSERDGTPQGGWIGVDHTGTFGYALRYDGP